MKRRTVLKGVAVAAGATLLGLPGEAKAACCERDHDGDGNCDRHPEKMYVAFSLMLPGPYDKLADQFQEGVEGFEKEWPDMEVANLAQAVTFDPFNKDRGPWLWHSAWEGEEHILFTPRHVIQQRRWDVIERALTKRMDDYWNQEHPPFDFGGEFCQVTWDTDYLALPGHVCRARQRFNDEAYASLGSVDTQFMALVTPRPQDIPVARHAVSDPDMTIHVNQRVKRIKS